MVMVVPSNLTTGEPTTEAVRVLPDSKSLMGKLPVMAARSWAEAFASSVTAVGAVIALRMGASLAPVMVMVRVDVGLAVVP